MATTRDFESLGVWAENAETIIPVVPVPGVAYRNTAYPQSENEEGELYNSIPDSANFNQAMFIISSFTDVTDKHGTVGWSDQVDYDVPAFTWADDGIFYTSIQASGPGTPAGIQDPTGGLTPLYWKPLRSAAEFELDLSSQTVGSEGARLVGTTYQPDPSVSPIGQTVQDALEDLNRRAFILRGLELRLAGVFDEDGILLGQGFNITNNQAVKNTSQGINYFSILPEDSLLAGIAAGANDVPATIVARITPQREINPSDTTTLLTSNVHVVYGEWPPVDPDPSTIKIIFTDPDNPNISRFVPFSIIMETVGTFDNNQ